MSVLLQLLADKHTQLLLLVSAWCGSHMQVVVEIQVVTALLHYIQTLVVCIHLAVATMDS